MTFRHDFVSGKISFLTGQLRYLWVVIPSTFTHFTELKMPTHYTKFIPCKYHIRGSYLNILSKGPATKIKKFEVQSLP